MKTYKILDTENNRLFKPEMINQTFTGEKIGEYIKISDTMFLATEVKEIHKKKVNTNKTKVIASIRNIYFTTEETYTEEYKRINKLKSLLTKRTVDDIDSIIYAYDNLISLYWLSAKQQINKNVCYWLKDTIKEILKSNIVIDNWEYKDCEQWNKQGIL